jgi:AraC family transcriptional regulator of adaptative response / DNA-3-methyladenine glycosylase II
MRQEFGCAPGTLRRGPLHAGDSTGTLTLRLQHRSPYAVAPMLGWLGARAIAGVETVDGTTYRRVLGPGIVELEPRPDAGHVVARIEVDDVTTVSSVVARCRRLLDLDADPAAVDETLGVDPLLRRSVARRPGLRVPGTVDGFELAVRAVVGQQISVSGARTLLGRIV